MKRMMFIVSHLLITSLLLTFHSSYAASPVWTFIPMTATKLTVPSNNTAVVQYRVTNQSKRSHTLAMKAISGVTQVTTNGSCSNPFVLGYQQSCILTLNIDGSQLTGPINGGPVVCQNGSSLQCYQPSSADSLNVSVGAAAVKYIYITNFNNNRVTQCNINYQNGLLYSCSQTDPVFNNPYGMTVVNNYAYIANFANPSSISQCNINLSNGTIITDSCMDTGGLFSDATSIAIQNGYAFVENYSNYVSACIVDPLTGNLTSCNSTVGFNNPQAGMAFFKNYIYITNTGNQTVSQCEIDISNLSLSNCIALADPTFSAPTGITIHNSHAYIANFNDNTLSICSVNQINGELLNCYKSSDNSLFDGPNGVSAIGNGYVYIENCNSSNITKCTADATTGDLTACMPALMLPGNFFDCPGGQIGFAR